MRSVKVNQWGRFKVAPWRFFWKKILLVFFIDPYNYGPGFQGGPQKPNQKKVMTNLRYLYGADSGTCDQKKMARASPGGDEAMPRAPSAYKGGGALVGSGVY